jgi:hypothetical protein
MATFSLGLLLGIALAIPTETFLAPVAEGRSSPNNCSSWSSTTRPPDYIRVLQRKSRRVVRVPFKKYVLTVLGSEWPSYLPQAVVEAGAVAAKQFGWYHAMGRARVSARGECFDVTDGIYDQLYKPRKANIRQDHHRAIAATWNVRLLKSGSFFMTAYRAGSSKPCGRDSNGKRLYARSAVRCARAGYNYRQILQRYYGPRLTIASAGSSNSTRSSSTRSGQSADFRFFDDRSRDNIWRGTWRRMQAGGALRDTLTYSGVAGSSATFRFTGRTLELLGKRAPGRGLVDVYVNGSRVARVNMHSSYRQPQTVFFRQTWAASATRTVKLVVVGDSSRRRVDIDAIRVK